MLPVESFPYTDTIQMYSGEKNIAESPIFGSGEGWTNYGDWEGLPWQNQTIELATEIWLQRIFMEDFLIGLELIGIIQCLRWVAVEERGLS